MLGDHEGFGDIDGGGADDARTAYEERRREGLWVAKSAKDFASGASDRFEAHLDKYSRSGVGEALYRSYRMFHGQNASGYSGLSTQPFALGEQGEYVYTEVNHYRNNILHQAVMVSAERPAFEPHVSTNSEKALEQIQVADYVLQYALDNRGLSARFDQAVVRALVESISWVALDWDPAQGTSGDVVACTLGVLDVAYQHGESLDDMEWAIARRIQSKWKLAAQAAASGDYELANEIAQCESTTASGALVDDDPAGTMDSLSGFDDGEMVYVYHVYYRPTPQAPEGRYLRYLTGGVVLEDSPFPFREIPVYPLCPSTFLGTQVPYSTSWDLMALQTLENAAISALYSRVDAFGLPNVVVPDGTEVGVAENGLALWTIRPGAQAPTVIDMLNDSPMVGRAIDLAEQLQNKISGVNSVNRGQPSPDVSSGSQAALYEAQSVKFHSALERAFLFAMERVGTGIIRLYQSFADDPMLLSIVGAADGERVIREFSSGDISEINNVSVKRTNPITRTQGFKVDTARDLLQMGLVDKYEYMTVAKTGNLEAIGTDEVALAAHVKDENSRLLRGEYVEAADFENHEIHLKGHLAKFDSRTRATDPQAAAAMHAHIVDHIKRWQEASMRAPAIPAILGIPPLPSVHGAQPGAVQPQAPPRRPGPQPAPKGAENPTSAAVRMPGQPSPARPRSDSDGR